MLKVQVAAVKDSKSRTLMKTIRGGDIPRGFESHALDTTPSKALRFVLDIEWL